MSCIEGNGTKDERNRIVISRFPAILMIHVAFNRRYKRVQSVIIFSAVAQSLNESN